MSLNLKYFRLSKQWATRLHFSRFWKSWPVFLPPSTRTSYQPWPTLQPAWQPPPRLRFHLLKSTFQIKLGKSGPVVFVYCCHWSLVEFLPCRCQNTAQMLLLKVQNICNETETNFRYQRWLCKFFESKFVSEFILNRLKVQVQNYATL